MPINKAIDVVAKLSNASANIGRISTFFSVDDDDDDDCCKRYCFLKLFSFALIKKKLISSSSTNNIAIIIEPNNTIDEKIIINFGSFLISGLTKSLICSNNIIIRNINMIDH